ncbi:MAG: DegT/DnrJ/EryC1/StrS family aminotransferase [Planctomycetota bacterium]|nr:DegT/DnrJ/EryC1/StrS family aminotransferase [Planctomycetota bacterium]
MTTTLHATRLALHGGPRAVPEGLVKAWPQTDDDDRRLVLASLEGGQHAFGPNCTAFQDEFAAWTGVKHAVATNSGTAALHMCIAACGCGTADEVIVPAYSWSSSATCVLHHSCIPVFVDIDFATMNLDEAQIEAAITPRTKAIIAVHLHGLPVRMDRVLAVAQKHGLKVIEDACQAHGAEFQGRKAGAWGDCAAFSFNQNKCLCAGEGGMFVTNDEALAATARQLWSFGETRAPGQSRDYHVYALGWMYRMSDLVAAFGRAQLRKLDRNLARQRENAALLSDLLRGAPGLLLPEEPEGCSHNWYNYTMRFDARALGADDPRALRDRLMKAMQAEGVQTGVWQSFILPSMTVFQAKDGFGRGHPWSHPAAGPVDYAPERFPNALRHCATHTGMTTPLRFPNGEAAVRATAQGIRKVLENVDQV